MARKVKILGIQMQSVFDDKVANYQKVSKALSENADFEPDLVLLPETFNSGYNARNFEQNAEPIPNDTTSMFLSGMAAKYSTNIAGTIIEKCHDATLKNTLVVFDREGALCAKYNKVHVFSHQGSDEGKYITAGDQIVTVDLDFGKVGLSVCYDLRFPELFRSLALSGAEIVLCPAAWPDVRVDHWLTLLKARAIENQFFTFGVNQVGKVTFSRTDGGNSVLFDPWGELVASCDSTQGVLRAQIDLDKINEVRTKLPVLQDRREDVYEI
ncbi:MAG: carbon-nitrogen family hydrolase [Candidatus Gastranaerophilales bacterium]|nr:carbon-nitrogen family hydrolase [Candidatus Gastranaerophilales bacterium]